MKLEKYWKAWLAFVVAGFIYLEVRGYKTGNTFTEWVWRWFNVDEGWSVERVILLVITLALVAGAVWLVGHLVWQKWNF